MEIFCSFLVFIFSYFAYLPALTLKSEQDEGLESMEETVMSTKHIALAVNEELGLQTRLIV